LFEPASENGYLGYSAAVDLSGFFRNFKDFFDFYKKSQH